MNLSNSVFISKQTIKRLIKDIKNIKDNNLESQGIYYKHDEDNLLKGYVLIIGPENTPYIGGYYFFQLNFPHDYPYNPPEIIYHTNQDKIRFNPNLYNNGLVCISILNTWEDGEPWSPCQSISTILLSILTLLNNNPLLNEPGVSYDTMYINNDVIYNYNNKLLKDKVSIVDYYNILIEYSNINIAICNIIKKDKSIYKSYFDLFYPIIIDNYIKNKDKLYSFCIKKLEDFPCEQNMFMPRFYFFNLKIEYPKLLCKLQECNKIAENYIHSSINESLLLPIKELNISSENNIHSEKEMNNNL